ncbi:MAG: hypothetical protein IJ419_08005 [Agathobacter sp.]|nr:hypothetical protein [Agathobacter sp.]
MKNKTIKSNKWLIRTLLLLAYLMPFSHLLIYYRDAPITLCLTAFWIVFLCVATLKTNNSSLIFPGHCLSFFVSFVCASYRFHSALDHPMACLPLNTTPHVAIISLLLLIIHLIIAAAYKKIQSNKNKRKETENVSFLSLVLL